MKSMFIKLTGFTYMTWANGSPTKKTHNTEVLVNPDYIISIDKCEIKAHVNSFVKIPAQSGSSVTVSHGMTTSSYTDTRTPHELEKAIANIKK